MEMASIIHQYYNAFMIKYAGTALPGHLKAMNAILGCRTPDSGELYVQCPDCSHAEWRPLSCGHRSCPNYKRTKNEPDAKGFLFVNQQLI
ncbi:MAG: transposase zinc-binding domain-containing protein [Deltaproteobacteria bacterium]|nr:transposase zinc-binding domain-containing protein [Deltaproteobacteria bacterium]